MKPKTNDPRPAYLQVADDLRASIANRTFQPGERLPSGRDLARRYGVAPMTISHALDVLRSEQLVEAYQGRGVFVADHSASSGQSRGEVQRDSGIRSLQNDLDQLTERVARIERILTDQSRAAEDDPEKRKRHTEQRQALRRELREAVGTDERTAKDEVPEANRL